MNARYAIGGHEEFPVLRLQPVDDDLGIDIPEILYRRWFATGPAIQLLRQRIANGNQRAERDAVTARWRIHDDLVRGNPTRIERP